MNGFYDSISQGSGVFMKSRVVVSLVCVLFPALALAQTASFSSSINWSQTPNLYFNVNGGPATMCGDLVTTRNGSLLTATGWICTDANGNATRGPWTWSGTPSDQTDTNVHINWANGTTTYATTGHVWDKTCPNVTISSAVPGSSFSGSATDNTWGAGFDSSWTFIIAHYLDLTTGMYWGGGSSYSAVDTGWYGSAAPLPSHSIGWSLPNASVPPTSAHISGHNYIWIMDVYDGDHLCSPVAKSYSFTY
jgi:hypothetical protein